jgi:acetoacetyl-CoA synthetase
VGVEPMWAPSPERVERANITRYLHWLRDRRGLRFASYDELWRWSVDDLDGFWASIWEFFEVGGPAPSPALAERRMPGARWFPEATLNHAELSLRRRDDHPALLFGNEAGWAPSATPSWAGAWRRPQPGCAGSGSPRATGWWPTCPTCPRR